MGDHPFRKSPRIPGHDYPLSGSYFIKVCAQNMDERFGLVANGYVELKGVGQLISGILVNDVIRKPGIELDSYVLMPNHLHAIFHVGTDPNLSSGSLLGLIDSFKSRSTVEYSRGVREGRFPPYARTLWQRSFYDRVLRDQKAVDAARLYIEENPSRWEIRRRS